MLRRLIKENEIDYRKLADNFDILIHANKFDAYIKRLKDNNIICDNYKDVLFHLMDAKITGFNHGSTTFKYKNKKISIYFDTNSFEINLPAYSRDPNDASDVWELTTSANLIKNAQNYMIIFKEIGDLILDKCNNM
jgi:hypothetical protein